MQSWSKHNLVMITSPFYIMVDSIWQNFLNKLRSMSKRVWKWIKENLTQNGVEKSWRGSSHLAPRVTASFTYPDRKKLTLLSQPKKGRFSPCPATLKPMRTAVTQPVRSCHNSEFFLLSNGKIYQTALPNLLLSSIKECSHLFHRLAYVSP